MLTTSRVRLPSTVSMTPATCSGEAAPTSNGDNGEVFKHALKKWQFDLERMLGRMRGIVDRDEPGISQRIHRIDIDHDIAQGRGEGARRGRNRASFISMAKFKATSVALRSCSRSRGDFFLGQKQAGRVPFICGSLS